MRPNIVEYVAAEIHEAHAIVFRERADELTPEQRTDIAALAFDGPFDEASPETKKLWTELAFRFLEKWSDPDPASPAHDCFASVECAMLRGRIETYGTFRQYGLRGLREKVRRAVFLTFSKGAK